MIVALDPTEAAVARRIVEIQKSAYAIEAALIGFDGIPQLTETDEHVSTLIHLQWRGAFDDGRLVGVVAWDVDEGIVDIDRLAVDPDFARRGHGRRLVRSVPTGDMTVVSTGTKNAPAIDLYLGEGFSRAEEREVAPGVSITTFVREP